MTNAALDTNISRREEHSDVQAQSSNPPPPRGEVEPSERVSAETVRVRGKHARSSHMVALSRRQVMVGALGLSFAFVAARVEAAVVASEVTGKRLSPWVSITPDGWITIMSPATE